MNKIGSFFTRIITWPKRNTENPRFHTILASLSSIGFGFIFGLLLLLILKPGEAFYGLTRILITGVSTPEKFGKVLYMAAPLVMTGLAVGFAFKTGLFNIGASGQYLMGAFFAIFTGIIFGFPWWLAIIAAAIGGAIWGCVPGIFKALLNVNEVITAIMFNWIGLFAVNLLVKNTPKLLADYYGAGTADRTANLQQANPKAIIPDLGLSSISNYLNISIFLTIIIAIIVFIILNKTIFGYELKAVGINRNASKYAGINEKRNIILSMTIAGALAGIGGAIYYLSGVGNYTVLKRLDPMGFNGIPVALLASSDPIGIIFSALFVSYIQVGGEAMQPEFSSEVIGIIIAVIIYLSAFSLFFKEIISKKFKTRREIKVPLTNPKKEVNN
jgi:simple sugar transport system permease protein